MIVRLVRAWFRRLTRRPTFDEWGMIVALAVASRADCSRRKVGAVILDRDRRIIGAGYNGTYGGAVGCLQGGCPRALSGVSPGSSYDTGAGACISVHAELNARLDVSEPARLEEATMYVTEKPCDGCLKMLRNTKIRDIYYLDEWGMILTVWPFQS